MIVNISLIGLKRLILQRSIKIFNSLLELFISIECQTSFIQNLRVSSLTSQSVTQILYSLRVLLDVYINITPLHEEILVLTINLQSLVEIVQSSLIVLHQSTRLPNSFIDTRVPGVEIFGVQEVFNGILVASFPKFTEFHLGYTSKVIRFCVGRLDLSSLIEILNSLLVILHILIDQATTLINKPIITDSIENFGETLQSCSQLPTLMLHQPQMIETGNMIIGYLQCLLEHIDSLLILSCILIGQTLAMEELGISRHQPDRIIEILVGEIDLLQGEIGITTIEQRPGIAWVQR